MKSSSEPIWKQHRRQTQEGQQQGGKVGGGGKGTSDATGSRKSPASVPGGRDSNSSAGTGNSIQIGRKLTQKLGKASAEGKFNKEEVLEILQRVRKKAFGLLSVVLYWYDLSMAGNKGYTH